MLVGVGGFLSSVKEVYYPLQTKTNQVRVLSFDLQNFEELVCLTTGMRATTVSHHVVTVYILALLGATMVNCTLYKCVKTQHYTSYLVISGFSR